MKYLDNPCPRCKMVAVVPPLKSDLEKSPILVKCASCNKKSRYNVTHHHDGTSGYTLSPFGRTGRGYVLISFWADPKYLKWSADKKRRALDAYAERV